MDRLRVFAVVVALLAVACGGGGEDDPLASMSVSLSPGSAGVLLSLPLEPDRTIRVNTVEPIFDAGLDVRYLGFVTRCGSLCGVTELADRDALRAVERAVEGTVPFESQGDAVGPHLLLHVALGPDASELLDAAGCLVVRRIDLELDDGETIGVTRRGFRFLWVIDDGRGEECSAGSLLVQ